MFAGSQSVSIEVRIIWYQSLALKSGLPFVSCYHSIFFRLCSLFPVLVFCCAPSWKKKKKKKKGKGDTEAPSWKKEVILQQQILSFYLLKVTLFLNCDFCSFSSLKKKKKSDFFLFPHWLAVSAIFCLAVGIGLNSASWISWSSLLVSGRTEKEKLWVEKGKRVWD